MPDPIAQRMSRILTMIAYVRRRPEGVPIKELAGYLGCSEEDVASDINAALLCGAPPYQPSDYVNAGIEGGRVFMSFADHIPRPVALTLQEGMALLAALRSLPVGVAKQETIAALRAKVSGLFFGGNKRKLREVGRRIRLGGRPPAHGAALKLLEEAAEKGEEVRMEYYTASRNAMTERELRPYGLVEHGGVWYVVGWCMMRDKELPFRVDRIRRVEKTGQRFEPPKNFDLGRYAADEMFFPTSRDLKVRIRLAPDLVRWVRDERLGHDVEEMPDGSGVLRLSVSRAEWLLGWLMQHGTRAEVLSPPALRKKMVEHCDAVLGLYGDVPGTEEEAQPPAPSI